MNDNEQAWLENRIAASVADDFYLDRDEEKGIKEEAAARGFAVAEIELTLRKVLDQYGAVSERQLVATLDKWLHQSTDDDKRLDEKEEKNCLAQVVTAAPGKKAGLDPRVAEDYVSSFCKANGIRRDTDSNNRKTPLPVWGALAVAALVAIGGGAWLLKGDHATKLGDTALRTVSATTDVKLSADDRAEIDDQLRRAHSYADAAQFTDPPEKSAKACLDTIHRVDPAGTYRGGEVKELVSNIVSQYMTLTDHAAAQKDTVAARKWIDRARLFNADSEVIREKELALGLVANNERTSSLAPVPAK
jgi:hypothetical protein